MDFLKTRHESWDDRGRRIRGVASGGRRDGFERRQPAGVAAQAVELMDLTGLSFVVEERNQARMIRHERFHRGLHQRPGNTGVRGIAAALEHFQHGLGDDSRIRRHCGAKSRDRRLRAGVHYVPR